MELALHLLSSELSSDLVRINNGTNFAFPTRPWLQQNGLQNTTIIMSLICFVSNMSFLLFTWKGKAFREWTAVRYLRAQEKQLRV